MITMEFEEMKRIWDTQNNEPVYAINEEALRKRIEGKKKQVSYTTGLSELIIIGANILAAGIIMVSGAIEGKQSTFAYLLAAAMVLTAVFMAVSRIRRMRSEDRFEASMLGDLDHAITNARYQVWLAAAGRWGLLPIALFTTLSVWDDGTTWWKLLLVLAFFVAAYFLSGKEYKCIKHRKNKLEALRDNLQKQN